MLENGTFDPSVAAYDEALPTYEAEVDAQLQHASTAALVDAAISRASAAAYSLEEARVVSQAVARKSEQAAEPEPAPVSVAAETPADPTDADGEERLSSATPDGSRPSVGATPSDQPGAPGGEPAGEAEGDETAEPAPRSAGELDEQAVAAALEELPPELPPLGVSPDATLAEQLQARLERVWQLLRMPMMQKLDMVIKYTSRELSANLESALDHWERGTAAILEREKSQQDLTAISAAAEISVELSGEAEKAMLALQRATVHVLKAEGALRSTFGDSLSLDGQPYVETHVGSVAASYSNVIEGLF